MSTTVETAPALISTDTTAADPYDTAAPGDPCLPVHDERACWVLIPLGDAAAGCTRPDGHRGQHVAEGTTRVLAVATQDEET